MGIKILVVDDEPHFERLILQRFRKKIRSKEYNFLFAQNGFEALEKLEQVPDVDLVLSDINMPKMDGLTLLSKLDKSNWKQKAVIVSAYGDMKNIRSAMNLGAYDFVIKPINFEDLEVTIQKAMKEIEMLKEAERSQKELQVLQHDLASANQIQQSILPQEFAIFSPKHPFEIAAKMIPAKKVGGDFYDFFYVDDNHLAVIIGDVSGKGMPAALFMAVSQTLLRATSLKEPSLSNCLIQVNNLLSLNNPASMFVTVFYALINLDSGEFNYISAGHNPPFIVQADQTILQLEDNQHLALGIMEEYPFTAKKAHLEKGASLVLYTDGVSEAATKEQELYTEERLQDFLKETTFLSPSKMVHATLQELDQFVQQAPQSDDITLVVLKHQKN